MEPDDHVSTEGDMRFQVKNIGSLLFCNLKLSGFTWHAHCYRAVKKHSYYNVIHYLPFQPSVVVRCYRYWSRQTMQPSRPRGRTPLHKLWHSIHQNFQEQVKELYGDTVDVRAAKDLANHKVSKEDRRLLKSELSKWI